jgi:hypothetical protein
MMPEQGGGGAAAYSLQPRVQLGVGDFQKSRGVV